MSEVTDLESEMGFVETEIEVLEQEMQVRRTRRCQIFIELQEARRLQDLDSNE